MNNVVNLQEFRNRPKTKPVLLMPRTLSEILPEHLTFVQLQQEIKKVEARMHDLRSSIPTLRTVQEREKAAVAMIPLGDKLHRLKTLLAKRNG